MKRLGRRKPGELRKVKIKKNYLPHAEGSVFFELGQTKVICTASVEENLPRFLQGEEQGWITAEYSMIPRSTEERSPRESTRGRIGGRTHEIQRLIGRALRSVVDLKAMPEVTIWLDCDVIQADGGTRTAAITGSYLALYDALQWLIKQGKMEKMPLTEFVAATSVGIVDGDSYLDLCFEEDARAEVDMNVVMTGSGKIIEVQGTAEKEPFSRAKLDELLGLAKKGVNELVRIQKQALSK